MRTRWIGVVVSIAIQPAHAGPLVRSPPPLHAKVELAASPTVATGRAIAAAALFDTYCLAGPPDFKALNDRASAAGYKVFVDRTAPLGDGQYLKQKNWLVPNPAGTFMLTFEDVVHDQLRVVGCGIVVTETAGADMENALSADPRLGSPTKRVDVAQSGGSSVWWLAHFSQGSPTAEAQAMLTYDLPGDPGVVAVNIIYKIHLDH